MSRSWISDFTCPTCHRQMVITRKTIWKQYLWKVRFCCYCGNSLEAEHGPGEIEEEPNQ